MKIDGMKVVDASRSARLVISPRDVKRGNVKDPGACAAALACQRKFHAPAARVHLGRTYIQRGKQWVRYYTGQALRSEIVAFDRGGRFLAGSYMLYAPSPTRALGLGQRGSTTSQTRPKHLQKRRPFHHITADVRVHGANR